MPISDQIAKQRNKLAAHVDSAKCSKGPHSCCNELDLVDLALLNPDPSTRACLDMYVVPSSRLSLQ